MTLTGYFTCNVNVNLIAFITRHKVNIVDTEARHGSYSLVVIQLSTSHQLLCVQVY